MACEFALLWAAQLAVEIDGPPSLFPPAEPAAASRICTASRHLHRHYRMRRKRRAARGRPSSGGPQFNVRTLGALLLSAHREFGATQNDQISLIESGVELKLL